MLPKSIFLNKMPEHLSMVTFASQSGDHKTDCVPRADTQLYVARVVSGPVCLRPSANPGGCDRGWEVGGVTEGGRWVGGQRVGGGCCSGDSPRPLPPPRAHWVTLTSTELPRTVQTGGAPSLAAAEANTHITDRWPTSHTKYVLSNSFPYILSLR